jgi:uncharacterized membrane protein
MKHRGNKTKTRGKKNVGMTLGKWRKHYWVGKKESVNTHINSIMVNVKLKSFP